MNVSASHFDQLPAEHGVLQSLVDLLEQEQQCLIHADTDKLAALTADKQQLLNQMNSYGAARNKALLAAGLSADDAGMRAALAAHGSSETDAVWERLMALTVRARELNRVNGLLIQKQLSHTQGALNALSPQPEGSDVYGRDGQSQSGIGSRRVVIG